MTTQRHESDKHLITCAGCGQKREPAMRHAILGKR